MPALQAPAHASSPARASAPVTDKGPRCRRPRTPARPHARAPGSACVWPPSAPALCVPLSAPRSVPQSRSQWHLRAPLDSQAVTWRPAGRPAAATAAELWGPAPEEEELDDGTSPVSDREDDRDAPATPEPAHRAGGCERDTAAEHICAPLVAATRRSRVISTQQSGLSRPARRGPPEGGHISGNCSNL